MKPRKEKHRDRTQGPRKVSKDPEWDKERSVTVTGTPGVTSPTGLPCSFEPRCCYGSGGWDGCDTSTPTSSSSLGGRTGPFRAVLMHVMSCFSFGARLFQCMCIPLRQCCYDWKQGARIGEATNPGPPSPLAGAGLLDGLGLREMIRDMVREAVKEAIREAFGSSLVPSPAPPARREKPRSKGDQAGDKSKGKGKDTSKGGPTKGPGKGDDSTTTSTRPAKPGKGQGATASARERQSSNNEASEGEWKLVERKTNTKEFVLRQQDWDSPLILYNEVSAELDKVKPDATFRAVVRCDKSQRALLQRILQGSSRKYSVLAVSVGREDDQDKQTQQRIPGRQGDSLVFRTATVVKLTSPDQSAPQPRGMKQAAVKLVRKPTEVVVVRVSKHFATKELWDAFTKNPQRSVVQWLADRHVHALDSFSWKDEKGDSHGHQLYGLVRLLQPEALTILGSSGQDGVFLDPTASMKVQGRVTWVERSSKSESHGDYHARAIKCAGDLGLVAKGSRLAVRNTLKSGDTIPRIWLFAHVPISVDPEQAKAILENYFSDVTMMRARGSKGERTFYFKAAHPSDPTSDLVPISLDTGEGVITTWARVAPPRTERFKQRQLPTTALPLEQKQTFKAATPVAVPTSTPADANAEAATTATGTDQNGRDKPTVTEPPAKRAAVTPEVRPVPKGLRLEPQPKDGACAFHCFAAGLKLMSKGKLDKHPRILRAECVEHLHKHSEEYKAAWDGKGPGGDPLASWDEYLAQISAESAYVSDLELKAVARLYDIKVVLIPELACFAPVVFHSGQKSPKRCLIMWYSGHHLDLLVVEDGKKLPTDIVEVTAAINFELRVGGESSSASSAGSWGPRTALTVSASGAPSSSSWKSRAGTVWTREAGAASAGARPTKATVASEANHDHLEAEAQEDQLVVPKQKPRFHWQGFGRKQPCTFRCDLCDFAVAVTDAREYGRKRYAHCMRFHAGEGLPGKRHRAKDYVTPVKGARSKYSWLCPLCPQGILDSVRSALSHPTLRKAKRRHKDSCHPGVSLAKWRRLCQPRAGSYVAAQRVTICNRELAKHFKDELQLRAEGFVRFVWPRPFARVKKRLVRVKFLTAWTCVKCGLCYCKRGQLTKHTSKTCRLELAQKSRKRHLKELDCVERWCRNNPSKHGMPESDLQSVFAEARASLGGAHVRP